MLANVVDFNLTLAGNIESFNETDFKLRLASAILIPVEDIALQVYPASIIVVARMAVENATEAALRMAALTPLTSVADASAILGVTVESIRPVTSSFAILVPAPSPPPPPPPPPLPPPALPEPSSPPPSVPPSTPPGVLSATSQAVTIDGVSEDLGLVILIVVLLSGAVCFACVAIRHHRKCQGQLLSLTKVSPEIESMAVRSRVAHDDGFGPIQSSTALGSSSSMSSQPFSSAAQTTGVMVPVGSPPRLHVRSTGDAELQERAVRLG